MLAKYGATPREVQTPLPGDNLLNKFLDNALHGAPLVADSAFTLHGFTPAQVWPWIAQLGKGRGGWYFPARIERFQPRSWRGLRHINPSLQNLAVGMEIDDWTGAKLVVKLLEPPNILVYQSRVGNVHFTWALTMRSTDDDPGTRLHSRTRVLSVQPEPRPGMTGPARYRLRESARPIAARLFPVEQRRQLGVTIDRTAAAVLALGLQERLAGIPG